MDLLRQVLATQPNITSLNLEFAELPDLEPLLPLLVKFPRLKELHLAGNRLSRLPKSLSSLKVLEYLDLSNNLFPDNLALLPSLQSLPALIELIITVKDEAEEQQIILALPNLHKLNDLFGKESQNASEAVDSIDLESTNPRLKQEDLEQVAMLYDDIRALWRQELPEHDSVLGADFDAHVKEVMTELYEGVKACSSPYLEHALMMQAKFDLFEICFQKTTEFVARSSEATEPVLSKLKQAHAQIVVELVGIVSNAVPKLMTKVKAAEADMEKGRRETNEVLEAAEQLEKENTALKAELEQIKRDRDELNVELEGLREENQRCLDALVKHSKATASNALSKTQEQETQRSPPQAKLTAANLQGRALSLKQLKDVIEEIYASKTKFDLKCVEGHQPRETMEQHMYTFLNQKYGLKVIPTQNLIIEWAAGIIMGVKKYSQEDNDVMVFGKILKNECDEEFRFVQVQVKDTIAELLKMFLKSKFPLKTSVDMEAMLQEKLNGLISAEEWTDVVKYMYNQTDADILLCLLQDMQERKTPEAPGKKKLTREELLAKKERETSTRGRISYKEFLKVLLDFQLRGHEKFLQSFVRRFRSIDTDSNGIINEAEFRALADDLDLEIEELEVTRLLQVVDPYNNQNVTFSECVALFSSAGGEGGMSVLQRLSAMESQSESC
jgi:hypothetical protein